VLLVLLTFTFSLIISLFLSCNMKKSSKKTKLMLLCTFAHTQSKKKKELKWYGVWYDVDNVDHDDGMMV